MAQKMCGGGGNGQGFGAGGGRRPPLPAALRAGSRVCQQFGCHMQVWGCERWLNMAGMG